MPSANPSSRHSPMLTVDVLAQRYGVTEATVLGWIHAGELAAVNVGRRPGAKRPRWRISEAAIESFERLRAPTVVPTIPPRKQRRKATDVIQFYSERDVLR